MSDIPPPESSTDRVAQFAPAKLDEALAIHMAGAFHDSRDCVCWRLQQMRDDLEPPMSQIALLSDLAPCTSLAHGRVDQCAHREVPQLFNLFFTDGTGRISERMRTDDAIYDTTVLIC